MSYIPALKLRNRLITFISAIAFGLIVIMIAGGALSLKLIDERYMNYHLNGLVGLIDNQLDGVDGSQLYGTLPSLLMAINVRELEINSETGLLYGFKDTKHSIQDERIYDSVYPLSKNEGYSLHIVASTPDVTIGYASYVVGLVALVTGLIIFFLVRCLNRFNAPLVGIEMLEERGRKILAGNVEEFTHGDKREWPNTTSNALTVLIEELKDARQERSRFDTFIRSQTFLDQLTGNPNRVLFDNKLESALQESGSHGGVMLVRIDDWPLVVEESGKAESDQFIIEVGKLLSSVLQRFPDVILSRYYQSDFAIFIPHQSSKDVANVAGLCLKKLGKMFPLIPLERDNWCHIGITMYREGENIIQLLDEVELSLKSAQLQNINTWSRFEKQNIHQQDRGSVKWRTVFDQALMPENLLLYKQECRLLSDEYDIESHYELFARIQDPERGELKASQYMSALEMVGYEKQLDQSVLKVVFDYLKNSDDRAHYSVNLSVLPFKDRNYTYWLRDELLQLPVSTREQLSIEFVERHLVEHLDYMRPAIKMLSGLGIKMIVNQVGRTIVSTHYVKDLSIDYVKLHRSLVRQIEQRPEDQLFVRSIVGACSELSTLVIAVGVENSKDWALLLSLGVQGGQGRCFDYETQFLPPIVKIVKKPLPFKSSVQVGRRKRWH